MIFLIDSMFEKEHAAPKQGFEQSFVKLCTTKTFFFAMTNHNRIIFTQFYECNTLFKENEDIRI